MKAAAARTWPAWFTRLAAAALAALSAASAGAQDLSITPGGRQGSYNVFLARDATGREMTVLSEGPINEAEEKALLALSKRAAGLRDLKLRSARVLLAPGEIDILLIPRSYVYRDQDLMPFLPGGIGLILLDGALSCDFRVLVGHYFLRIKGPLENEDALSRKLVDAATTPAAYLRADTMEYVSDRFAALEGRLTDDEGRGTAALQNLQARVGELEAGGGAAPRGLEQMRSDLGALRTSVDGVRSDLESVKASLLAPPASQVDADVEALQKTVAALGVDAEALRTAVVVLQSRGGNFGRRGVDRDAISRLVALKRANPALTQADASKALKAQGASMSNRDIALVFGIFFGDYR